MSEKLDKELSEIFAEETQEGERELARKFVRTYHAVRKGLVAIRKARNDTINSAEAVEKARTLLMKGLEQLE